jgi:archaemetzincin
MALNIHILPVAPVPPSALQRLRERLGETFGARVSVLGELPLPSRGYDAGRGQHLATELLRLIEGSHGRTIVLGVTEADLYAAGMNFVCGQADPRGGAAVISLARLRQEFYGEGPDEELFLERAAKEAVHETGHLLGLPHCPDAGCVMHFSNSLRDTDRKGAAFCPACRAAVARAD